jgi:hypothetical protein
MTTVERAQSMLARRCVLDTSVAGWQPAPKIHALFFLPRTEK